MATIENSGLFLKITDGSKIDYVNKAGVNLTVNGNKVFIEENDGESHGFNYTDVTSPALGSAVLLAEDLIDKIEDVPEVAGLTVITSDDDNRIGVGKSITIDDDNGLAWGYNVRSRRGAVSFGYNIDNTNTTDTFHSINFGKNIDNRTTRGVCFGAEIDITAGLASIVAVGDNITIGADYNRMVVIGHDITLSRDFTGNGDGVVIGNGTYVGGWKAVTIGYKARCEGTAQMAIGWTAGCYDNAGHTIAIGRGTGAFTDNAIVLGSYSNYDLWIGNGDAHIFNNTGNGGDEETLTGTLSDKIATYHGPDACDKRDTPSDFSVAGGSTRLICGASTGDAVVGKVYISVYRKRTSATGFENTKTSTILDNIIVDQDDVTICEARIWRNASPGIAYFTHKDMNNSSDFGFRQQSNGATDVNAKSGQVVSLKINNALRFSTAAGVNTSVGVPLDITSNSGLRVQGTQVVGTRKTGWGAPTGTATRTAFATGSVSTTELAERVKALIDDLTTHGLIGT